MRSDPPPPAAAATATRPPRRAPNPPGGQAETDASDGNRLIRSSESEDLRRRWESIQASFIDSPREAVQEADRLVGELTGQIAKRFRSERSGLDE